LGNSKNIKNELPKNYFNKGLTMFSKELLKFSLQVQRTKTGKKYEYFAVSTFIFLKISKVNHITYLCTQVLMYCRDGTFSNFIVLKKSPKKVSTNTT
jgi:hypothetical protein